MRRSPLKRNVGLKAKQGLGWSVNGLKPQSSKRQVEQKDRRELSRLFPEERCWLQIDGFCTGWAEHWHELVGSGQGGSRTDKRNLCAACDACNSNLEDHRDRYARGWKVKTSDAMPGRGGLVPKVMSHYSLAYRMGEGL